jgi:hypothetical protein
MTTAARIGRRSRPMPRRAAGRRRVLIVVLRRLLIVTGTTRRERLRHHAQPLTTCREVSSRQAISRVNRQNSSYGAERAHAVPGCAPGHFSEMLTIRAFEQPVDGSMPCVT